MIWRHPHMTRIQKTGWTIAILALTLVLIWLLAVVSIILKERLLELYKQIMGMA